MMRPIAKQYGMGVAGIGIVTLMTVLFFTIFLKLVPAYLEHYSVKVSLESLADDPVLTEHNSKPSKRKILSYFRRRLDVNDVESINFAKDVKIKSVDRGYKLVVKYDYRTHMMGNIDAIVYFTDEVVVRTK